MRLFADQAELRFWVPGEPIPQPRPRARAVKRWSDKHRRMVWTAVLYEAERGHPIFGWKDQVARVAKRHRPPEPITGPVELVVDVYLPRPLKHYIGGKPQRGVKPTAPDFAAERGVGDGDNFQKAIQDVLEWEDVGILANDCQVVSWGGVKRYRSRPGAMVTLRRIG